MSAAGDGKPAPPEGCWYNLVGAWPRRGAGRPRRSSSTSTGVAGERRLARRRLAPATRRSKRRRNPMLAPQPLDLAAPLPDWARRPPPPEPTPPRPLAPSQPRQAEPPPRSPLGDDARRRASARPAGASPAAEPAGARRRGAAGRGAALPRAAGARSRRSRAGGDAGGDAGGLDHPDFAPLFWPGSHAEVPVVGADRATAALAGPDRPAGGRPTMPVLIVDYKTIRPPPRDERRRPGLSRPARGLPRGDRRDLSRPRGALRPALDRGAAADADQRRPPRCACAMRRPSRGRCLRRRSVSPAPATRVALLDARSRHPIMSGAQSRRCS